MDKGYAPFWIAAGGAAVLAVGAVVGFTGIGRGGGDTRPIDQSEVKVTAAQAGAAATHTYPGVVQGSQLETLGGRTDYAVVVRRADGQIVTVDVDATSGKVIAEQNGNVFAGDGDGD